MVEGVSGGLRAKREAKSGDNSLSILFYRYTQPNRKYFCYKYEQTKQHKFAWREPPATKFKKSAEIKDISKNKVTEH